MDNRRDEIGNLLCPVCGEVIDQPERSPIIGTERVHPACWFGPFFPRPDVRRHLN